MIVCPWTKVCPGSLYKWGERLTGKCRNLSVFQQKIHSSAILKESEQKQTPENQAPSFRHGALHKVNSLEKYMLVWAKKYPSVKDVPDVVSQESMEKTRNKTRIYINIGMVFLTLLACLAMIQLGKRDQAQGKSVQKMNLEWHRKIKEEEEAEAAKNK